MCQLREMDGLCHRSTFDLGLKKVIYFILVLPSAA